MVTVNYSQLSENSRTMLGPPASCNNASDCNTKHKVALFWNFEFCFVGTQRSEPCELNWGMIYEPAFLFIRVRRERVSPLTGISTANDNSLISSLCSCTGNSQNSSTRDRRTPTWSPGGPGPHLAQS